MKKQPDTGIDAVHTRVRVAMQDLAAAGAEHDLADAERRLDLALAECEDGECEICASIVCPYGEPLHFHHDGCPACAEYEDDEDEQ